jgi:hypothetical protein
MSNEVPQDELLNPEQLDAVSGGASIGSVSTLGNFVSASGTAATTRTPTASTKPSSVDPVAPGYLTIAGQTAPRPTVR